MKEARLKRPHIVWSHLYGICRIGIFCLHRARKQVSCWWGGGMVGVGMENDCVMGMGFPFSWWKSSRAKIVVMVVQQYEYCWCKWIVHFKDIKLVNFMLCVFTTLKHISFGSWLVGDSQLYCCLYRMAICCIRKWHDRESEKMWVLEQSLLSTHHKALGNKSHNLLGLGFFWL